MCHWIGLFSLQIYLINSYVANINLIASCLYNLRIGAPWGPPLNDQAVGRDTEPSSRPFVTPVHFDCDQEHTSMTRNIIDLFVFNYRQT